MKKYCFFAGFGLVLTFLLAFNTISPTAMQLANQMLASGREVQTLKFSLQKQERIKGKLVTEKSAVKMQVKPFKAYLKYETPSPGMEVLYVTGQNNNEAYIRPSSFPWTTISLNPESSTMRSGQHHTLLEIGFNQILAITDFVLKKYGPQASSMLTLSGTTSWEGRNCYQLILNNPNFKYVDYTVGKNEDLVSIAGKFRLSEYMILEKNPSIDAYDDVSAGQKIKIPTDYARKISILLDQKTNLPLVIKAYDDLGLFEQYEYHNLQVNPTFKEVEFTKTYKEYKF